MRVAEQRSQGRANPPAVDTAEVAAQQGVIHLAGAPRVARHHRALKLRDSAIGAAQTGPRDGDGSRPLTGRQRALSRAVPIALARRRANVVGGPHRREQLLLEDGFDGAPDALAQLGLKILTELKNG